MRLRTIAATSTLALVALLAGCGDDDGTAGPSPAEATTTTAAAAGEVPDLSAEEFDDETGATEVDVTARDNTFTPQYIEVDPGTTVTFTNRGRVEHNVLPVIDDAFEPIEIDDLQPGDVSSITFDEPGEYPYYCSLHGTTTKGMVGAIRVLGE
jgi:plastocyanin